MTVDLHLAHLRQNPGCGAVGGNQAGAHVLHQRTRIVDDMNRQRFQVRLKHGVMAEPQDSPHRLKPRFQFEVFPLNVILRHLC